MVGITNRDYQELLGYKEQIKDLMKRGMLEGEEFTTMQQERKIVRLLRNHLEVMKQWKPRDETTSFHIKYIEDVLNTTDAGKSQGVDGKQ